MKYTHMGRSRLLTSRIGLGTMNFGPASGEQQSHRILSRALEGGINLVDTADVYGWELDRESQKRSLDAG